METLKGCFKVDGIYTFENIGFSMPFRGVKYLFCADCEKGPVGYHLEDDTSNIYLSSTRTKVLET